MLHNWIIRIVVSMAIDLCMCTSKWGSLYWQFFKRFLDICLIVLIRSITSFKDRSCVQHIQCEFADVWFWLSLRCNSWGIVYRCCYFIRSSLDLEWKLVTWPSGNCHTFSTLFSGSKCLENPKSSQSRCGMYALQDPVNGFKFGIGNWQI
jgi:hypothetical protein